MKIKMKNITQVVNWHTGSTIFTISLSLILRILKWNDSHLNQPRLAACDLLKHKAVSPSSNSQWLLFSPCKGQHDTAALTQGRASTFYEEPRQSSYITHGPPTGFGWGAQRKFLCLFRRRKSAILRNVHNPQNEEPFSSANNKLESVWDSVRVFHEDHAGNLSHKQGGCQKTQLVHLDLSYHPWSEERSTIWLATQTPVDQDERRKWTMSAYFISEAVEVAAFSMYWVRYSAVPTTCIISFVSHNTTSPCNDTSP